MRTIYFKLTDQAIEKGVVNHDFIETAIAKCEHPLSAAQVLLSVLNAAPLFCLNNVYDKQYLEGMNELVHVGVIKLHLGTTYEKVVKE